MPSKKENFNGLSNKIKRKLIHLNEIFRRPRIVSKSIIKPETRIDKNKIISC